MPVEKQCWQGEWLYCKALELKRLSDCPWKGEYKCVKLQEWKTNLKLFSKCNAMFDSIRRDAVIWNWVKTTHYSMIVEKPFQNARWLEFMEILTSWPGTEASDFHYVHSVDFVHPQSWGAKWSIPLWLQLMLCLIVDRLAQAITIGQIRKLWPGSECHFTDSGTTGYTVLK